MLTFEKVLETFKDYLNKDDILEVVTTKRGYTTMIWDENAKEWFGVEHCATPEKLRDVLLGGYCDFLEQSYTHNRRNLTDHERMEISKVCSVLRKKCNS